MAKLIYAAITSLDGYIEDEQGTFDWAEPDDEVHAFVNDLERDVGTYLYGRRMYDMMIYWETADTLPDQSAASLDFAAIWQAADKIVYSSTLQGVSTERTTLRRTFDPVAVRDLKASAESDLTIGGSDLAAQAFRAGLVDEVHLFLHPISVGGGKPALPPHVRLALELHHEQRFAGGVVHLRYGVTT